MTKEEKFVKQFYPDARCLAVDKDYRVIGKFPFGPMGGMDLLTDGLIAWYVIYINHGVKIDNLGASRKSAINAWKRSVYWVKRKNQEAMIKKLES